MQTIDLGKLSSSIEAYKICKQNGNKEWEEKHEDTINEMLKALPHGNGIDNGVKLEIDVSSEKKLIFTFGFHHMDENGYYDGWTDHNMYVTPTFGAYHLKITGQNKDQIKDYLYDLFYSILIV